MKTARVKDFSLILTGLLTQYDQKESLREMRRGGRPNIYRLGNYLRGVEKAEEQAKRAKIWDSDAPSDVLTYRDILKGSFIYEGGRFALAPVRQLERQVIAWVEQGKLPKYGKLEPRSPARWPGEDKDNPAWTKVFG